MIEARAKTYGAYLPSHRIETANGRVRAVVAAASKREAAEAMQVSLYMFNQCNGTQTWNPIEEHIASTEPGVVFIMPMDAPVVSTGQFERVPRGERP